MDRNPHIIPDAPHAGPFGIRNNAGHPSERCVTMGRRMPVGGLAAWSRGKQSRQRETQEEPPMSDEKPAKNEKPNEEHLAWAIDQRAAVQHTLRALYGF